MKLHNRGMALGQKSVKVKVVDGGELLILVKTPALIVGTRGGLLYYY